VKDNIKAKQNAADAVEDIYEITLLLDFYGQLLTKRQHDIMDDYYNNDLSLGEIAENLGISRQAVYDGVRKAKKALVEYEKKLGLVERFSKHEQVIEQALHRLSKVEKQIPECMDNQDYQRAMDLLSKVLDTL
jgi:predicted DNA-binding protein YlxM (UPF0122 family)